MRLCADWHLEGRSGAHTCCFTLCFTHSILSCFQRLLLRCICVQTGTWRLGWGSCGAMASAAGLTRPNQTSSRCAPWQAWQVRWAIPQQNRSAGLCTWQSWCVAGVLACCVRAQSLYMLCVANFQTSCQLMVDAALSVIEMSALMLPAPIRFLHRTMSCRPPLMMTLGPRHSSKGKAPRNMLQATHCPLARTTMTISAPCDVAL